MYILGEVWLESLSLTCIEKHGSRNIRGEIENRTPYQTAQLTNSGVELQVFCSYKSL